MLLEQAMYARAAAFSGLIALVSTRIYPAPLPQEVTYPAVSYQRVSGVRDTTHSGSEGLQQPRIQFSAWGRSYGDAKAVAEQLRLCFHGAAWTDGDGARICVTQFTDTDLYDDQTTIRQVACDALVIAEEAAA